MKFILLALLSLVAISCASHERDARDPASAEKADVSRGVNADYYGGSFR